MTKSDLRIIKQELGQNQSLSLNIYIILLYQKIGLGISSALSP